MAESPKPSKPPHPLKRLLKKASRSKVSLSSPDAVVDTSASIQEEDLTLLRQTSMALTVPDEHAESSQQPSPVVEQPESPSIPKEVTRRASLVGKIKGLAGDRKAKKSSPIEDGLDRVQESESDPSVPTKATNPSASTGVKPIHVVKRVKDLLQAGPPFYPTTLIVSATPDVTVSTTDSGIPAELTGASFLATLSDQSVMTGNTVSDSVFKLLERAQFSFRSNSKYQTDVGFSITATDDGKPDSSIMLYAPLVPDEDSVVELADFHLVQMPLDETDDQLSTTSWWPPWKWGKSDPPAPPTKTVRIWIPSTTKISVQLAWWGFRIWLPEPVVKQLSQVEMDAVKKAAMIATALGWLVNHIPTTGLPLELLAVLTVAKALVPILGYIGGFLTWYWSAVTGYDNGQGVVLSATWLLPIALIPGRWDYTPPTTTNPTSPTSPTTPAPAPSVPTPAPAPAPAPTNPAPAPAPNPPPSMPNTGEGSPMIVIPPAGGVYVA